MAKGNPKGNPDKLIAAAEAKKNEAIKKTENAIANLSKSGQLISFPSVAKAAGVSVSYLYKYEEIKGRITHLREQQQRTIKKTSAASNPHIQSASDKSKAVIIYQVREENKKLRLEIEGLRRHIEVIQGRAYELAQVGENNSRLKRQLESVMQELEECRRQQASTKTTPLDNSKVASLDKKRSQQSDISDNIKSELARLGILLNSTLTKTFKSASFEIVESAIEALKEAMASGIIEKPGDWLNKAIKDGWIPNEKHLPQNKVERDIFKEWFDLAYKQRLVLASTKGDDGQICVYTIDGALLPFEQMLAEYPLEQLKKAGAKV